MISWWTRDRLLRALVICLALATLGGFFRDWAWWLDVLSDFRAQYAIAAAMLLIAALARRRVKETLLALVLVAVNGAMLTPFLLQSAGPPGAIKIISFNLNQHNLDSAPTLDFLRRENADVVIVTEATETWLKAFEQLSDLYPHRFYAPPHWGPGDKPHMVGLLSKLAWVETGVMRSDMTSRAFGVWARFPAASPSLTVSGVHLMNPLYHPAEHQKAEAEKLASTLRRFQGPVVVAGDFNMTPFSIRYGNLLRDTGLRRAGGGLNPTWPSLLAPLGLALDHVLVGRGVKNATLRSGPRLGSDHLPIVGTFSLAD